MRKKQAFYPKLREYLFKKFPILEKKKWTRQLIKASLFGGLGVYIHIAILFVLTEFFGVYYLISGGIGFIVGSTNNYFVNKRFTFNEKVSDRVFAKYLKFIIVSISALIISLGILYVFTEFVKVYYVISQLIANIIAFLIVFVISKFWIFDK
ncbi:GtrA family protein [Nanoarchaeota archaeon]